MTEISDDQVREVLWASSDEGKAQLRAAWSKAVQLGLTDGGGQALVTMADVGALLWAAHEAVLPGDQDEPRRSQASGPGPAREKFRELLAGYIRDGRVHTTGILQARLERAGFDVPRETVFRWLAEDRQDLAARHGQAGEDEP